MRTKTLYRVYLVTAIIVNVLAVLCLLTTR